MALSTSQRLINRGHGEMLHVLAGVLTPETLAAVIGDLTDNDQLVEKFVPLHERAKAAFRDQLNCMVGEDVAREMLGECRHCGTLNSDPTGNDPICGHCGELWNGEYSGADRPGFTPRSRQHSIMVS
jgi:hypothetical protein